MTPSSPRLLLTGASGLLGAYVLQQLRATGTPVIAWSGTHQGTLFDVPLRPVDLTRPEEVADAFRQAQPQRVLHTAALARINDCHRDPELAHFINVDGTSTLVNLCAEIGARLVLVSTDLVFDGERAPYREEDSPTPVSIYGQTKVEGERRVLAQPRHCVARVSLLTGPSLVPHRPSFFDAQITALRTGKPITLFADEWRTPLDLATAAHALVELTFSDCTGLFHIGGPQRLSRLEMGLLLAEFLGADPAAIVHGRREQAPAAEPRPRDVSLDSSRWRHHFPTLPWPAFRDTLGRMGQG
jgi:dTDP-4-dehydrorhamnose reductase